MEEDTIRRWVALDAHRMNDHTVNRSVPLWRLLMAMKERPDDIPPELRAPKTRGGHEHVFDLDAVAAFAEPLSRLTRAGVELPIKIWLRHQDPNDAYVQDTVAIEAIQEAKLAHTTPRDGKLWLGRPLAATLIQRFPTVFQFVYQ